MRWIIFSLLYSEEPEMEKHAHNSQWKSHWSLIRLNCEAQALTITPAPAVILCCVLFLVHLWISGFGHSWRDYKVTATLNKSVIITQSLSLEGFNRGVRRPDFCFKRVLDHSLEATWLGPRVLQYLLPIWLKVKPKSLRWRLRSSAPCPRFPFPPLCPCSSPLLLTVPWSPCALGHTPHCSPAHFFCSSCQENWYLTWVFTFRSSLKHHSLSEAFLNHFFKIAPHPTQTHPSTRSLSCFTALFSPRTPNFCYAV